MEDDEYSEYESSPVKDSSVWRNGPAKLFFDQLGIPTEGDLDYGTVLRFIGDSSFEEDAEPVDNESENGEGLDQECRKIDSVELDLAVQSILLEDASSGKITNASVEDINGPSGSKGFGVAESLQCDQWTKDFPTRDPEASAKQKLSEVEVSNAVDALIREMDKDNELPLSHSQLSQGEGKDGFGSPVKEAFDFNLVSQLEWEKDVVWTPETAEVEKASMAKVKQSRAGWIPTLANRKFEIGTLDPNSKDFTPLFPVENDNLIKGNWERDIIWDVDEFIDQHPHPKILYFDATDEQIVFQKPKEAIPTDQPPSASNSPNKATANGCPKKAIQPHAIKSKLLLGKAGFIQWKWQMEQQELKAKEIAAQREQEQINNIEQSLKNQPSEINYNLSNDEFYIPKDNAVGEILKICALNFIRHSKVVSDFISPYMTTYLSDDELKNFHRPQLRNHSYAPRFSSRYRISSCYSLKMLKAKERDAVIKDGHPVLLDKGSDLTGTDGELVLIENSEEHPPLLGQVGMCSKIINYYKRKSLKDPYAHGVPHPYGETIFVYGTSSPFLGFLEPGQVLSALENNMYRSPIYLHSNPVTDFMLIINKHGYFVREFDAIFTAGQQCPLIEVPEPNSTRTKLFLKNLLLVHVYRKFARFTVGSTARIKLNELCKSFPGLFESTLRSWLKHCAEIKKIGTVTYVVMKNGFVLPDESELKEMATPEQCCAYYSLLAAEKRLKDAGCDSMLSLPERAEGISEPSELTSDAKKKTCDPNDQINQSKLAEELKAAPWNTTSAFVAASKGKCLLQVIGPADPTGCGEGFSYIRVAKKSNQTQQEQRKKQQSQAKKDAAASSSGSQNQSAIANFRPGGTDADLRRLSSKRAKEILRKAGLPEKEIAKLSRWEVIDVLRTLSTEKAKQGENDDKGIGKFCRWQSKTNSVMNQERYREDCQRVFDLQNKVLSSNEVLSTDDEEEDDDNEVVVTTEADINQMGRSIEQILKEGKTASQLAYEEEEIERLELQRMMLGGIQAKDAELAKKAEQLKKSQDQKKKEDDFLKDLINNPGRKLKISRTFKENGKTFLRTEIVRDPVVIAAYLKIRNTKSEDFIKSFLQRADRQQRKEEKLKEKMLLDELQDQRVVQNEMVKKMQRKRKREMEADYFPNKAAKIKAAREIAKTGRKCGACGLLGHTRTNPICPMNNPDKLKKTSVKKEKRGRGRPPRVDRENYGQVPVVKPPKLSKQMEEVMKKQEELDRHHQARAIYTSSDSSDEEDAHSSDASDSSSDSEHEHPPEDQTMVKVDGLKMVLKVPQVMVERAQIEEQQEEEAARILLSISAGRIGCGAGSSVGGGGVPRRRVSQAEREHADYLNVRNYKTTAADRIRKKD